jgi:hypothetical protein
MWDRVSTVVPDLDAIIIIDLDKSFGVAFSI